MDTNINHQSTRDINHITSSQSTESTESVPGENPLEEGFELLNRISMLLSGSLSLNEGQDDSWNRLESKLVTKYLNSYPNSKRLCETEKIELEADARASFVPPPFSRSNPFKTYSLNQETHESIRQKRHRGDQLTPTSSNSNIKHPNPSVNHINETESSLDDNPIEFQGPLSLDSVKFRAPIQKRLHKFATGRLHIDFHFLPEGMEQNRLNSSHAAKTKDSTTIFWDLRVFIPPLDSINNDSPIDYLFLGSYILTTIPKCRSDIQIKSLFQNLKRPTQNITFLDNSNPNITSEQTFDYDWFEKNQNVSVICTPMLKSPLNRRTFRKIDISLTISENWAYQMMIEQPDIYFIPTTAFESLENRDRLVSSSVGPRIIS